MEIRNKQSTADLNAQKWHLCVLIRGHYLCGTNLLTFGAMTFQLTAWCASWSLFKRDQSGQCQSAAMTLLLTQTWMKSLCTREMGAVSRVPLEVTGQDASLHRVIFPWRLRKLCIHFFPFWETEMEIMSQHVLAGKIKIVLTKFSTHKQSWPRATECFFGMPIAELPQVFLKPSSRKSKT